MYARITRTDGLYDREIVIDFLCTGVVPVFESIPGYRGMTASADPITGDVWTISVWDSCDAVWITDELSEHLRETWLAATHRQFCGVEVYELQAADVAASTGPTVGCALQMLPFSAQVPGALDRALAWLREDLVPELAAQHGLHAVRLLVDREASDGLVLTVWADAEAGKAALEATTDARARAATVGIDLDEPLEQEIIFTHVLTRTR